MQGLSMHFTDSSQETSLAIHTEIGKQIFHHNVQKCPAKKKSTGHTGYHVVEKFWYNFLNGSLL
jgi:hypothetical protein